MDDGGLFHFVSEKRIVLKALDLKLAFLVVVSKVAKSLSATYKLLFVRTLNKEVLPALV